MTNYEIANMTRDERDYEKNRCRIIEMQFDQEVLAEKIKAAKIERLKNELMALTASDSITTNC
jgi:hypothetical protein